MLIKKTQEEMDRENEPVEEEDVEEYVSADEVEANQVEQEVPVMERKKAAFMEKFSGIFKKREKPEKKEEEDLGNDAISLLERNEQEKEDEKIKKDAIDKFIDIAMNKGIDQALSAVKKTKSAYYVDEFHDRLIEELKKVKDNKSGK